MWGMFLVELEMTVMTSKADNIRATRDALIMANL